LLAALAAFVLLVLAYRQMRANRERADATRRQVELMAADAERERRFREADDAQRMADQSARELAIREQLAAVAEIAGATREAARAQLQPIVFAHAQGSWIRGPKDEIDLAEGWSRSRTTSRIGAVG
jgi:hypothetical protein